MNWVLPPRQPRWKMLQHVVKSKWHVPFELLFGDKSTEPRSQGTEDSEPFGLAGNSPVAFRPRPVAFGLSFFRCFRKSARFATALPLMKEETPELTRADKLTSLQGYILWCVKPFTMSSCSVNSASDSCHILGRSPWFLFNLSSRYCNKSLCSWTNSQAFGQREVSIYRAIQSSDVLKCLQLQSSEPAICKKETWSGLFFPCLDLEAQQEVSRIQAKPLKKMGVWNFQGWPIRLKRNETSINTEHTYRA